MVSKIWVSGRSRGGSGGLLEPPPPSEPVDGFWPNLHRYIVGKGEHMIKIWWLWPYFQGHSGTLKSPKYGFCVLSSELVDEFWPNLHSFLGGEEDCWEERKSRSDFDYLDLILKVTPALWNVQNRVYVTYLLNQWMDFDQTCIDTLMGRVD